MKESTLRFSGPIDMARPRGTRLLEGFSLKLGRPVRLFDRAAFDVWVELEADPEVTHFCERPVRLNPDSRIADFWVRYREREQLLVLDRARFAATPVVVDALPVRTVAAAEIAAARTWIDNWQRMLPVVVSVRGLLPAKLVQSILSSVTEPVSLAQIERRFAMGDPTLVRGTVFELLRTGRLRAPSLHTNQLSLLTTAQPCP